MVRRPLRTLGTSLRAASFGGEAIPSVVAGDCPRYRDGALRSQWQHLGDSGATMSKQYHVYILANRHNSVLYTGVTNDLKRRVWEHREKRGGGFTSRYNVNKLVYYEGTKDVKEAIAREKQIKGGSRRKKTDLVDGFNPGWQDLYDDL